MHSALAPHDPGQGSLHFLLTHAISVGHSEFDIHSGWQFGGLPKYSSRQAHDDVLPTSLQIELGPQGDGIHGFMVAGGVISVNITKNN